MVGRTMQQSDHTVKGEGGRGRRVALAVYAVLIAVGAYVGALGLVSGFLRLPPDLEERLPLASPVLGGIALTVIVAVPATVVAVLAWLAHRGADLAAVIEGLLLIGWIVVELAFIRELSYFHVIYVVVGLGLIAWGRDALGQWRQWRQ